MSLPADLQHRGVPESAGLVRSKKVGRVRMCSIEPGMLSLAEQWINARRVEWQRRLDRPGNHLVNLPDEEADDAE